ncbi:MAG: hypothetical protein U5K00_17825 [Melioribacteraceae bacterium]|nr:hypothetical protein [Melioribacteraceae bacterium]
MTKTITEFGIPTKINLIYSTTEHISPSLMIADPQNKEDSAPSTLSEFEVRQTAFASAENSILDDVLFVRYSFLYKGLGNPSEPDTLKDVIFSIWNDADIGDAVND